MKCQETIITLLQLPEANRRDNCPIDVPRHPGGMDGG